MTPDDNAYDSSNQRGCLTGAEISSFLSGWLDEDAHDDADKHIEQCDACRQEVERRGAQSGTFESGLRDELTQYDGSPGPLGLRELNAPDGRGCPPHSELIKSLQSKIGPYRILEPLGSGGMGTVFRATHTKLNREVALKLIQDRRWHSADAVARFEREMQLVGQLVHPNIVTATDAGEHDGVHFLAMEVVDGIDLSTLVQRHGPLSVGAACELTRQAAVGLQFAHERGIVHRDIKPSNLMLAQPASADSSTSHAAPVVRILDFGLAQSDTTSATGHDDLTTTGQIMGTVDYMAPEQAEDTRAADVQSDIYSLGATFFKLLTARGPLDVPTDASTMKRLSALTAGRTMPLSSLRQDVPAEVVSIVERMLAHEPGQRFGAMSEVIEEVRKFADTAETGAVLISGSKETDNATKVIPSASMAKPSQPTTERVLPRLMAVIGAVLLVAAIGLWTNKQTGSNDVDEPSTRQQETTTTVAGDGQSDVSVTEQVTEPPADDEPAVITIQEPGEFTTRFASRVNLGVAPTAGAQFSKDGLRLYFAASTPETLRAAQLYVASRERLEDPLTSVRPLVKLNEPARDIQGFCISADELTIIYGANTRHTGSDLWIASRKTRDEPFDNPIDLGPNVNSDWGDEYPSLSADGLELYFDSSRVAQGKHTDLYVCRRPDTKSGFSPAVRIPMDADQVVSPCLSPGGLTLWFHTFNPGPGPGYRLAFARRDSTDQSFDRFQYLTPDDGGPAHRPWFSHDERTMYFADWQAGSLDNHTYRRMAIPKNLLDLAGRSDAHTTDDRPKLSTSDATPVDLGVMPERGAWMSRDDKRIYFSIQNPDDAGRSFDIYLAHRASKHEKFSNVEPLRGINTENPEMFPVLTPDELTIFFSSRRPGSAEKIGGMDIMWCRRESVDEPFSSPEIFMPDVNSVENEHSPFLSHDGEELFFASARRNGGYEYDLWVCRKSENGFSDPSLCLKHGGPTRFAPCLSPDGRRLFFQSMPVAGQGQFVLSMATRDTGDDEFGDVVQLTTDRDIESGRSDESPWLSADGETLFFLSRITGSDVSVRQLPLERPATQRQTRPATQRQIVTATTRDSTPVTFGVRPFSAPRFSPDGLRVYFSDIANRESEDIFIASRDSLDVPFNEPRPLAELNLPTTGDAYPGISADELIIVFASQRGGGTNRDIWMATRSSRTQPFGEPVKLNESVNSGEADHSPVLTADGLELYFVSTRHATERHAVYVARRASVSEEFSSAERIEFDEARVFGPCISPDGLTLWAHNLGTGKRPRLMQAVRHSRSDRFKDFQFITEPNWRFSEHSPFLSHDETRLFYCEWEAGERAVRRYRHVAVVAASDETDNSQNSGTPGIQSSQSTTEDAE